MLIFLYGQDSYRAWQKLQEIVSRYRKLHQKGLDVISFDLARQDYRSFLDQFQTSSLFEKKRLFILREVSANPEFKKNFLADIKKFSDNLKNIIVFYEPKEIKKEKFFEQLKKYSKAQEFKPLTFLSLRNWIKKEVKNCEGQISQNALDKLLNYVGQDLWQLANEIKKLVNYKKGQEISEKDIDLLVAPKIEADIFKTIEAIALENGQQSGKKKAILLLKKHLRKGDSPLYLLSMIIFQFRNLLIIKNSRQPGLHPYVIKKTMPLASKFSLEKLKRIYQKLLAVDLAIKTGQVEPETSLDLLIAGL